MPLTLALVASFAFTTAETFEPVVVNLGVELTSLKESQTPGEGHWVVGVVGGISDPRYVVLDLRDLSVTTLEYWASSDAVIRDGLLVFPEKESFGDLNGDEDTNDSVVRVVDLETKQSWSTGVAVELVGSGDPAMLVSDGWLGILASEFGEGIDLDGNGVISGRVPFVFDLPTATFLQMVPLFSDPNIAVSETAFAFDAREAKAMVDLNGDGDLDDTVVHYIEPRTGRVTNTALASRVLNVGDQLLGVVVLESSQDDTDLNGDGDTDDAIVHVITLDEGGLYNTGMPGFELGAKGCLFDGSTLAFLVDEFGHGDLNGNGNELDAVWHALQFSGPVSNVGLGISVFSAGFGFDPGAVLSGGILTIPFGGSYFTYELATQELVDTGAPVMPQGKLGYALSLVEEFGEDLNGDLDGDDEVYAVYSARSGVWTNLEFAGTTEAVALADLGVLFVNEFSQGGEDLNANGLLDARLPVFFDPVTHATCVGSFPVGAASVVGDAIFLRADEGLSLIDHNRDGDLKDSVTYVVVPSE